MGKFHDLMDRDLQIRGYTPSTCRVYLDAVKTFVRYFKRPPDELTTEDINEYQWYLTRKRKVSWSHFNVVVCALRFFFTVSLRRDWPVKHIPYRRTGRKLPEILGQEEIIRFFTSIPNLKHRVILMTIYAAGIRIGEALHLRPSDIDSARMVLRVDQGKGRKDRNTLLSPVLLGILREYWKIARPKTWLFPHRSFDKPLSSHSIAAVVRKARKASGIGKAVRSHSLRHAFATHLLEKGVNIRIIQTLLGHSSLRSTEMYTHVSKTYLQDTKSPLDSLPGLPLRLPPKR